MGDDSDGTSGREDNGTARGVKPAVAIRNAREQLSALLGREPESVSALARTDQGWTADVEVLELERIPDSTSVLATYTVQLDADGDLIGYERRRRYSRGQVDRR
ncbi:gas vesicle protein GvpO [Peterkaempfera griseoplana]|uniref:gas vesicle protein GvpO n=1 Tax=Peterkaempfera griseoplana TaxID=66896 RepID=UPI0006E23E16|nr:gas vesicle protein [Peterkaempfera griseoplana]